MLAPSLAALCRAACRFVTVLVSNSSGWIADGLANSGTLTMTQTRKLLQVVGSVGPGKQAPWKDYDLCRLAQDVVHEACAYWSYLCHVRWVCQRS